MLILSRRSLSLTSRPVVIKVTLAAAFPDAVLLIKSNIEPDRTIERSMLVHAEPGQFIVESLRRLCASEIPILQPPVRDGSRHPMHQLSNRVLSASLERVRPVRDISIKVLRDRNLGRQRTPRLRYLHILLPKNDLATVVSDFRRPSFPFDVIQRSLSFGTEDSLKGQSLLPCRTRSAPSHLQIAGMHT